MSSSSYWPSRSFFNLVDGSRSDAFDGTVKRMIVLAGILSVALFLYLVVALLKPEWFV